MHGVAGVFLSDAFVATGTSATSSCVDTAGRLAFFFAGAFLAGAFLAGAFFTGSFFTDFTDFFDAFFTGAFFALWELMRSSPPTSDRWTSGRLVVLEVQVA